MSAADAAGVGAPSLAAPTLAAAQHPPWAAHLQSLPAPIRELIAGGVSGGYAKTCVAPLERCKILFQTGRLQSGSVFKALQDIFRSEGVPGLFRGNGASVLRIVPYSALYMSCYERYRRALVDLRFMASHRHDTGRVSPVVDLVAGSSAGATAVVATYPLDLVRTRLAYMTEARQPGRGAAAAAAPAVQQALAEAGQAPRPSRSSSSNNGAGGGSSAYHRHLSHHTVPSFGGSLAAAPPRGLGIAGSHMRVPALLAGAPGLHAATRHSVAGAGVWRGLHVTRPGPAATPGVAAAAISAAVLPHGRHTIGGVLSGTLRAEGLRGLYHGMGPSLYGILPYAGLKFYVYQHLKGSFYSRFPDRMTGAAGDNPRLPVPAMLTFGAVAGLMAQTATYPLDVVRRRMQVEGLLAQQQQQQEGSARQVARLGLRTTPQALVLIWQREGWRALFAGLSINYMKVVPSTAIGFTVYDYMKHHMDLPTNL